MRRERARDGEVTIMYVVEEGERDKKWKRERQIEREWRNRKGWRGGKTSTPNPYHYYSARARVAPTAAIDILY